MKIVNKALVFGVLLSIAPPSFAQMTCGSVFDLMNKDAINIALVKEPLPEDVVVQLKELVDRDPDLREFLENPTFIELLQAMANGKSTEEIRPLIYDIWKDPALADHSLGKKTGALLIGPNANNNSKLIEIIKKTELSKAEKAGLSKVDKIKFTLERLRMQVKGLRTSIANAKKLIQEEMHPNTLDANLFDFYGYLNLGLDASRLREWKTPEGSFGEVKLSNIKYLDPTVFTKVLMLASQIEAPIGEYSDASGSIFRLFPQAARFMGKTPEQLDYHNKSRKKLHCTNSWCEEENRHEGLLENLARRIMGSVLPNSRPFSADKSLSPYKPADVDFHVMARANNEMAASSTYFVLGAHAEGNTATYLENIRGDELKHSTIFAGLYHYLRGNTYWTRLGGVIKKTLIEVTDKNDNSEYAAVFKSEPVAMIEFAYTAVNYERQVKKYIDLLPLKTLRKFFETDINLDPLPEEAINPAEKSKIDQLGKIEKSRREALANWPQAQREAAYKLEYFESERNAEISSVIAKKFNFFKGAEDFGSSKHNEVSQAIEALTANELSLFGFDKISSADLKLLKKSLNATLRDYQIINNRNVRKWGLSVQFVDAVKGFDIVRDENLQKQRKVELQKSAAIQAVAHPKVILTQKVADGTVLLRVEKPDGYNFSAGASANVVLQSPQGVQSRILSIASSPSEPHIEFAVRVTDSYFKTALSELKPGQSISLEAPKAAMKFNSTVPGVMIAGGIGITPFRAMLKDMADRGEKTPMTLLYANRKESDIAFKQELDALTQNNANIKVDYVLSQAGSDWKGSTGRIDRAYLEGVVRNASSDTVFYIVAPLPMVQAVRSSLSELGISANRIVVESFMGYR